MKRDSLYSANTIFTHKGGHAITITELNTYTGIPSSIKAASAPEVAFLFCIPTSGKVKHIKYYIYD